MSARKFAVTITILMTLFSTLPSVAQLVPLPASPITSIDWLHLSRTGAVTAVRFTEKFGLIYFRTETTLDQGFASAATLMDGAEHRQLTALLGRIFSDYYELVPISGLPVDAGMGPDQIEIHRVSGSQVVHWPQVRVRSRHVGFDSGPLTLSLSGMIEAAMVRLAAPALTTVPGPDQVAPIQLSSSMPPLTQESETIEQLNQNRIRPRPRHAPVQIFRTRWIPAGVSAFVTIPLVRRQCYVIEAASPEARILDIGLRLTDAHQQVIDWNKVVTATPSIGLASRLCPSASGLYTVEVQAHAGSGSAMVQITRSR